MPRLSRVHSFLDRFEQRLQVDCQRLKRQLLAQVDQQFGVLRSKVAELRSRFGGDGVFTSGCVTLLDDPPAETVQLDQWRQTQLAMAQSSAPHVPSTSTGHKRKSSSTSRTVSNKRQKTRSGTADGPNKYRCKSPGCGKSFRQVDDLTRHERIHMGIKPFSCNWPDCRYSAVTKGNVVKHVRTKHFKLPELKKEQLRLNIVDNRNPEDNLMFRWITNCWNVDSSEIVVTLFQQDSMSFMFL